MNDLWNRNIRHYLNHPEFLPDEERQVFLLLTRDINPDKWDVVVKVHQRDFTRIFTEFGSHEVYEEPRRDSTLRKVRQIIRNLRVEHGVPVLSDREGYWLPRSEKEVASFVGDLRAKAKAMSKSYFETYSAVKKATGITDSYFEQQTSIFDQMENEKKV